MFEYRSMINDVDDVTKEVSVSFGASLVEDQLTSKLGTLQKTAKIKGFRPGKVPAQLLRKMYGEAERARVVQDMIIKSLTEILENNKISSVGSPEIKIDANGEDGSDVEYSAKLAILPQPEIDFSNITVTIPAVPPVDEEAEKALENLRKRHANVLPIADRDVVEQGDVVAFTSRDLEVEGKEVTRDGKAVVGENEVMPALDQAFVGKKVGETFELTLPIGEAERRFAFTLNEIGLQELPELDDEFAKKIEAGVDTLADLKSMILASLTAQADSVHDESVDEKVLEHLLATYEFAVPEVMVQDELAALLRIDTSLSHEKFAAEFQGKLHELSDEERTQQREVALRRVRGGVILNQFRSEREITVSEDEVMDFMLKQFSLGSDQKELLANLPAEYFSQMRSQALHLKCLEELRKEVAVTEEEAVSEEEAPEE